jgi:hypothetical protein
MKFAHVVFQIAGAWGVLLLTTMYFLFDTIGRMYPPALTHPDVYYGFLGVTMAWQMAFFVISADPLRFRPVMIPAIFEKFVFVATLLVLFAQGRIVAAQMVGGAADLILGILFVMAFAKTGQRA